MHSDSLSGLVQSVVQELYKIYYGRHIKEDRTEVDKAFTDAMAERGVELPELFAGLLTLSYKTFELRGVRVKGIIRGESVDVSEGEHIEWFAPQ